MRKTRQIAALSTVSLIAGFSNHVMADATLVPLAALSSLAPQQKLVFDSSGNLFGTGVTSIFELSGPNYQTSSTVTAVLGYTSQVVQDSAGNFYVAAAQGGPLGAGAVYMFSGPNHQTVTDLMSFSSTDSYGQIFSAGGLTIASNGDLFGATSSNNNSNGALFKLSGPTHQTFTYTIINPTFTHPPERASSLGFDKAGNLVAAVAVGDIGNPGFILKVDPSLQGTQTTLATYATGADSLGDLTTDTNGNIYGTLQSVPNNQGEVFELSGPNNQTFTVLATFNGSNGSTPLAGVTIDANGNIFGTTSTGGLYGHGTVFELSGANHETFSTILNYTGVNSGGSNYNLIDGLTPDQYGNLYTAAGGSNGGTGQIFELTNTGFAVPEPASLAMIAVPLGVAQLRRRRRRRPS